MIVIDMDMPESCVECPLFDNEYSRCQKTKERCETWEFKPTKNCPIKCDIEQIRAEVEDKRNVAGHFDTKTARAQVLALSWVIDLIDKYADQEPCDNHEDKPHSLLEAYFRMRAEQEPCDDVVSRKAVLDGLKGCICEEWIKTLFATMVKQLPPVRPQEQTGKWEFVCQHWRKCSECGFSHKFAEDWNYCPNCGSAMKGE